MSRPNLGPSDKARLTAIEAQLHNLSRERTPRRFAMRDLTDVSLVPVANGQVPTYDFASGLWKPGSPVSPATSVVSETSFGQAPIVGGDLLFARQGHSHGTPPDPVPSHLAAADPHSQYVDLASTETISGLKTFSSPLVVGDPAAAYYKALVTGGDERRRAAGSPTWITEPTTVGGSEAYVVRRASGTPAVTFAVKAESAFFSIGQTTTGKRVSAGVVGSGIAADRHEVNLWWTDIGVPAGILTEENANSRVVSLNSGRGPNQFHVGSRIELRSETGLFLEMPGVAIRAVPLGQIGYKPVTANQTLIGAAVDLTGLTVDVEIGTSRKVKITAKVIFQAVGGTVNADLGIYEGATELQRWTVTFLDTWYATATLVAIVTPADGPHTYKLRAAQSGGGSPTLTMHAGATYPAFILVEDIGQAAS